MSSNAASEWLLTRRRSVRPLLGAAAIMLAIAGCGGGGSTTTTGKTNRPGHGHFRITLATAARQVEHALKAHDCAALAALSVYPVLGPVRCHRFLSEAPDPTLGRVASYGAGAAADLILANGKHAAALFVIGSGRKWRFAFAIPTARPVVGTPARYLPRGGAVLSSVLHAMTAEDCSKVLADFMGKPKGSPSNCYGHAGSAFLRSLRAGYKGPRAMGGNAAVAFYLVVANQVHPFTFVVVNANGTPRFAAEYENAPLGALIHGKLAPR